jgi:WD40 repeat protein
MKRLYLLSDAGLNATGLAHDTLAPIVSQEFRRSDRPGQRAALILENKRIAFEQDENSVLDIDDLRLVEEGASGMRIWMKKEEELIEKSRVRRAQLLAEKKRNRFIINSLTLAVCIGLIVALWQWRTASLKAQANALVAKALQTEPTDPTKALRMVEEAQQISASPDTWQLMSSMMGKHEFYQQRFEGHRNRILDAALQGEFVFTVGEDSTLRKWDRKGQLLKTVEAHQGYIFALSSNGQLLATASADGLVKIWDEALSPLQTINAHEGGANEVCWAGDTLFTAGQDGRIACYLATGQALWRIQAHTGGISAMAAYQGRLFSVGEDSTLRTWTHAGQAEWSKNLQTQIFDVEVLSNAHIATADNEGKVRFWDMEGNEAGALFPQTPAVRVLKALPDGQLLTAADYPATTAKRWNMEGKLLSTFEGHGQAITAFAVQDHYLITGSRDHTALLWDLRGRRMQSYSAEAPILQAQYSEYGNLCFISGPYFFFDGEKRFEGHTADITCFSLHESSIATGSRDSTVRFWSSQGQNLRTIKLPEEVTAIAESSNRLFVATRDNLIRVLDKQGKILDSLVGHTGNISAIVILPNGQISSAGFDSTLRVWDVHTKQAQILRPHAEAIADLALWGNDLLSGGWDGYARGKGMTFRLSEDFVNAVAVHHNTITLGSFDGDIGIFDEKGALLQRFKAHAGGINSVSFGRECLLTAGDDSKLHLWFLQPEDFLNSGRIYKP